MRFRPFVAASLVVLSSVLPAQQPVGKDWNAAGAAWWSHVQYLADDRLEGRKSGTPGFELAVQYVESQFKQIGLKPAGTQGYRQAVTLIPATTDVQQSSFALGGTTFELGPDVALSPYPASGTAVDAPLVFIGYGLSVPRKHVDDLAGLDLKGKVAVFWNNAPENLLGPQRAYARGAGQRWKALRAAGAVGMIQLGATPRPGAPVTAPPARRSAGALRPEQPATLLFADASLNPLEGIRLNATLTRDGADKLLAGSGHDFAELKQLGDAGKPLPHFDFKSSVQAKTVTRVAPPLVAPNTVGLLEGSDPKLKKQYLVISAHLDHLGVTRPVDGDSINNGAMDNASGVASVIEAAKLLSAGPRPKRSILFVALMGEELGEFGSAYFAAKPTVPKQNIVADLNMDMYLPLFPLRYLEIQGLGESTLGNDARAICQLNDVEPQFDKQPEENRFVRSDQVNFVKEGIPALAFKFGWTPDSPEMKTFNTWVATRYHKPSDDLEQPVDKVGAAQFTSLLAQLATRVANAPGKPEWYPESSFATAAGR